MKKERGREGEKGRPDILLSLLQLSPPLESLVEQLTEAALTTKALKSRQGKLSSDVQGEIKRRDKGGVSYDPRLSNDFCGGFSIPVQ